MTELEDNIEEALAFLRRSEGEAAPDSEYLALAAMRFDIPTDALINAFTETERVLAEARRRLLDSRKL